MKCLNINGFMGFNFARVKLHSAHVLNSDWEKSSKNFTQTDGGACSLCEKQFRTPDNDNIKRLATHTPIDPVCLFMYLYLQP